MPHRSCTAARSGARRFPSAARTARIACEPPAQPGRGKAGSTCFLLPTCGVPPHTCRLNFCRIAASSRPGFTGPSPTRAAHSPLGMHIYPYYKKYTPQIISEIYYLRKQKDSPILDFPQLLTFFSIFTRTSANLCFPRANGSLVSQTVFCCGPAAFYLLPANDRSFATNRGHFAAAVAISPIAPRFLSRTRRVSCHTFLLLVFCFPRPPCHALFFPFCGVPSLFCSLPVAGFLPRFAFLKRPLLVLSSVGQRPPFVVPRPFAVFLPSSARLRRARSSFSFAADMPSFARQSMGAQKIFILRHDLFARFLLGKNQRSGTDGGCFFKFLFADSIAFHAWTTVFCHHPRLVARYALSPPRSRLSPPSSIPKNRSAAF